VNEPNNVTFYTCERSRERAYALILSLSYTRTHARTHAHALSLSHTRTHACTHAQARNLVLGFLYSHSKHRLRINRLLYVAEKEFVSCKVGVKLLYKFTIQVNL
jgi:hypothetical protein